MLYVGCAVYQATLAGEAIQNSSFGTIQFSEHETRAQGRLAGCGWEFKVVLQDDAYVSGGPVLLSGSLNVFYFRAKPVGWALKLQGHDVIYGTTAEPSFKKFEIPYGYMIAGDTILAHREDGSFRCETGGFCAAYSKDFEIVLSAIVANKLRLAYSRTPTGIDVSARLLWSDVAGGRTELSKGMECISQLMSRFTNQD
jgi:hypothetical protein